MLPETGKRLAIVGSGIWALTAAKFASESGWSVSVFGGGSFHAENGSSGETRLFRTCYSESESYVPLAIESKNFWQSFEQEVVETIFLQTGQLEVGATEGTMVPSSITSAYKHNLLHQIVPSDQLELKGLRIPSGVTSIVDIGGGILLADKILSNLTKRVKSLGANIYQNSSVIKVRSETTGVSVQTQNETSYFDAVWVSAAHRTPDLFEDSGDWVRSKKCDQVVLYFNEDFERLSNFEMPFSYELEDGTILYGFPKTSHSRMKLALHSNISVTDPKVVLGHWARLYPELRGSKPEAVICPYDLTEDGHFVFSQHPKDSRIWLAYGSSGHGFKFAPALARMGLQRLVNPTNADQDIDIRMWNVVR